MLKEKKVIVILAVIAGLAFLAYLIYAFAIKSDSRGDKTGAQSATSKECQAISEKITLEIDKMNYCKDKNDCTILNECPDNCGSLINRDADMSAYLNFSSEYRSSCSACASPCIGALRADEIACESGKCASLR